MISGLCLAAQFADHYFANPYVVATYARAQRRIVKRARSVRLNVECSCNGTTATGCWAETLSHHAEHVLTGADVERSIRIEPTGSSRFGIVLCLEPTDSQLGVLPLRIHDGPCKSFSEQSQIGEI